MPESNFKKLEQKLSQRKGVTDPAALAAYIGRKKYGEKGMAKRAAAGRRAAHDDLPDLPQELEDLCNSVEQMREEIDDLAERVGVKFEEE